MQRGVFITFEGSEGCGKSTQIQSLAKRCQALNQPVLLTREPGGTPIGEVIRHLLKFSEEAKEMRPETELLLFTASRAQLVRERVQPALDAGNVVIADRFYDSTTVYQGVARKLDGQAVNFINAFAVGGCKPDITFLLDLDPELAHQRMLSRAEPGNVQDRMESEPLAFYQRVRGGYLDLARKENERIVVIDAAQSIEAVERQVWSLLNQKFHGFFQSNRL